MKAMVYAHNVSTREELL